MSGEGRDAQRDNGSPGKQKQPQEWRQAGWEWTKPRDLTVHLGRAGRRGLRRGVKDGSGPESHTGWTQSSDSWLSCRRRAAQPPGVYNYL